MTLPRTDWKLAYSPAEAAEALGISRTLLYELIAEKEIKPKKVRTRTIIERAELEDYLSRIPHAA